MANVKPSKLLSLVWHSKSTGRINDQRPCYHGMTELKPWWLVTLLLQLLSLKFSFLRLLLSVELFACELLWNTKCSSCRIECSHERALWKLTSLWKKKTHTFNQYFIHKGTRVGHDVIHLLCYVNKDFFNQKFFFFILPNV